MIIRRICVFCGSAVGQDARFASDARELARLVAKRGMGIVYGGGNIGLMGVLADAALAAGAEVIGVIPIGLAQRELAHPGITKMHTVQSMHERKSLMANLADAFVALPGGFGTLEELLEIITWAQLRLHKKPIGLLNIAGFYDPLLEMVEVASREGFIRRANKDMLLGASDPNELLEKLVAYKPEPGLTEWQVQP